MLVGRIKEFIKQLQSYKKLSSFDQKLLQTFEDKFLSSRDEDTVSTDSVAWIEAAFKQRWHQIADTIDDYTFNPFGNNEVWIQFAKDFAKELHKTYLQVLIPVTSNTHDPILLTRLTDCNKLRGFYVGEDTKTKVKTLRRVRGLLDHLKRKNPLSTYEDISKKVLRPLSLEELLRIRAKTGSGLKFSDNDVVYNNFWDYLQKKVIPDFQNRGSCPHHLLPPLLDLVQTWFSSAGQDSALKKIKTDLLRWSDSLMECPIDTTNNLYGQVIDVGGQSQYLVDVLLDCVQGNATDSQMIGISRWLCGVNPSLICKHDKLQGLYAELKVGPSLGACQLQKALLRLDDGGSTTIRLAINTLARQMQKTDKIDPTIIVALREIYQQRWLKIMGKNKDYTRLQKGANEPWIQLAQLLCGSGRIEANYYRFLMSTLTHDEDVVRCEILTVFPLSAFILSEDGKSLILLDNCAKRFQIEKTFYNCNTIPPTPLTKVEIERAGYAQKRFQKYINATYFPNMEHEPLISLSTVHAIKDLVDGSLYPNGLILAHDYSKKQMASAELAYQVFFDFIAELQPIERQRLNAQRIFFDGTNKSFAEVLDQVKKGGCIALYGKYFAQLVMDYAPDLHFRRDIEDKVDVSEMRLNSRSKVCSDHESIADQSIINKTGFFAKKQDRSETGYQEIKAVSL